MACHYFANTNSCTLDLQHQSAGYICTSRLCNLTCYFVQVETGIDHYLQSRGRRRRQPYMLCLGTRNSPAQLFVLLDQDAIPCRGTDVTSVMDRTSNTPALSLRSTYFLRGASPASMLHRKFPRVCEKWTVV